MTVFQWDPFFLQVMLEDKNAFAPVYSYSCLFFVLTMLNLFVQIFLGLEKIFLSSSATFSIFAFFLLRSSFSFYSSFFFCSSSSFSFLPSLPPLTVPTANVDKLGSNLLSSHEKLFSRLPQRIWPLAKE